LSTKDLTPSLVVGPKGELAGFAIELLQAIPGLGGSESAFDPQDFYSNALGRDFFKNFYEPGKASIADQMRDYFGQRLKVCPIVR